MSDKTGIEWTRSDDGIPGATWNPVRGCSKVSEGCRNCYAMNVAYRFSGPGQPYEGLAHKVGGKREWTNKVVCVDAALALPTRWKKPRRVFVNSMSDLFHPDVPEEFILRVFAIMAACPQHTFQVLTKRPHRMWEILSGPDTPIFFEAICDDLAGELGWCHIGEWTWPLANVWLGVSAEDQATANERIPWLLQTPAAIRWVSAEPLLGPVDLTRLKVFGDGTLNALNGWAEFEDSGPKWGPRLDWVVCGGESGPGARPMHPDWARQMRDQCSAARVPFFFKQWGEFIPRTQVEPRSDLDYAVASAKEWGTLDADGTFLRFTTTWNGRQEDERDNREVSVNRVGKKRAGRLLDGREWNEYPSSREGVGE